MNSARFIAIEGPIGVGKTTLTRLLQSHFKARVLLEVFEENPFLASFYADHTSWIRFSQATFNLCGILILPFFTVIVVQMKRMKNQSHVFAYCYLTAVVSGATIFALSNIFFLVAAFRPDRSPDLIMLLDA